MYLRKSHEHDEKETAEKKRERDGENAISTYVFQVSVLVRINRNQIVVQKHQCQRAKITACNRGAPVKEQSYTVWRAQLGHRLYFEVHRYFASLLRFDFEICEHLQRAWGPKILAVQRYGFSSAPRAVQRRKLDS